MIELTALPRIGSGVALDVTTFISAQDYMVAQNEGREPGDPFARQSYAELVQSIIFHPNVYVIHPLKLNPIPEDFGDEPQILRELLDYGVVKPLAISGVNAASLRSEEQILVDELESIGVRMLFRLIDQTLDNDAVEETWPLAERMRDWTVFQRNSVHVPASHAQRIKTMDGIEEDRYGEWIRNTAKVIRKDLSSIAADGEELYIVAILARGLRHQIKAQSASVAYQPHPIRRDFLLGWNLRSHNETEDISAAVLKQVRGIYTALESVSTDRYSNRLAVLKADLPLLGGRIWESADLGRKSNRDWLHEVAMRICGYWMTSKPLRQKIADCKTTEDLARLFRDLDEVKYQLLDDTGLRPVGMNEQEKEVLATTASVGQAVTGIPIVRPLWIAFRSAGKRVLRSQSPHQAFVYREVAGSWKRAGK